MDYQSTIVYLASIIAMGILLIFDRISSTTNTFCGILLSQNPEDEGEAQRIRSGA